MKNLVTLLVVVAACGGAKSTGPVSGQSETPSLGALDTVVADLEALRPFVVVKDDTADCAAYTPAASELVATLALHATEADATRKASGDAAAQWQSTNKPALEKLLTDVVKPTRNVTGCAAMEKDATWSKVSLAFVAVAEPAQKPAPVLARAALIDAMLAAAPNMTSKDDCKKVQAELMTKHPTLEADFKALSPIDQFVDDKVWEEDEEKRAMQNPHFQKMAELCFD